MKEHDNTSSPQANSGRIRLRVLGISYSQLQSGAYALILAQVGGPFRIPVVIGASEAQAIALKMEGVIPPRPLTHDLITSIQQAFGIELREVFIYRFEDGIFYSEITMSDGERTIEIDSRTSDAIAIAMRCGAPIYTTPEILAETGFELEIKEEEQGAEETAADPQPAANSHTPRLENYAVEELEKTLARLIEREEYEEAARVSEILRRKKGQQDSPDK
ncbi:MAG: bifunctional nuclease family protein [Muribaculaceae bacterium]|nr:bifunctional nuclease family protein [Muribaculaceae bacterium]